MQRAHTNFSPRRRAPAPSTIATALPLALALASPACGPGDPYEAQVAADAETYARAVKQLETEEKLLVNRFKARMDQEQVEPVGITLREAIETQRAHEDQLARAREDQAAPAAPAIPGAGQLAPALISTLIGALDPGVGGGAGPTQIKREFKWRWSSGGAPAGPLPPGPKVIAPPPDLDAEVDGAGTTARDDADDDDADKPAPTRMTAEMLRRLLDAVAEQRMQRDKLQFLLGAIPQHTFDTEQAAVLTEQLFPQRRVEALAAFYPQLVDPENFDDLARALLVFPGDLESLRRRLQTLGISPAADSKKPSTQPAK